MILPPLKLRGLEVPLPIIQGGMGIGYANHILCGTVGREGGLGVLSSAALDRLVSYRTGQLHNAREAAAREVADAKTLANGGAIGMNVMVAVIDQYKDSVLGSMDGGVDVIISGAGLPISLPTLIKDHPRANDVALIPIVSSARALKIIMRKWSKQNRLPDGVVVEGPLAGGHIGWADIKAAFSRENSLENLVLEVLDVVKPEGIPVIAAGGIHNRGDIEKYLNLGCSGVQMGTRFLATHESGASEEYKKYIVDCNEDDIILSENPGSPCGLLFRVIKNCPFYEQAMNKERKPKCSLGYVLNKGACAAKDSTESFCICNGLLPASYYTKSNEKELYTVGARAHEITEIISVSELMAELSS
jgi:nitronate monooxygenase